MGSRGMRFHPSLFLSLRGMKGSKKEREGKDFSLIRGGYGETYYPRAPP